MFVLAPYVVSNSCWNYFWFFLFLFFLTRRINRYHNISKLVSLSGVHEMLHFIPDLLEIHSADIFKLFVVGFLMYVLSSGLSDFHENLVFLYHKT